MYWFGEENSGFTDWLQTEEDTLLPLKKEFRKTSVEEIISVLNELGEYFKNNTHPVELIEKIQSDSGFSKEEVIGTLGILPTLLSRESLMKRLRAEFTNINLLDRFTKLPHQDTLIKAQPLGLILHVTAGNVFLSSIDSLIMGLITKNLSIVKVSSENKTFPLYFAQCLKRIDSKKVLSNKFAILHWKGGDQRIEPILKRKVNAIVAWGGEEMISSYRHDLPSEVKFLDFGPKVSFQVISKRGLSNHDLSLVSNWVVSDVTPWNQGACASPQDLFIQEGIDEKTLLNALDLAFRSAPKRGIVSDDEAVEILKEKYRALYSELMEGGSLNSGDDYLLHLEDSRYLRPSPLNRSVIIKRFKDIQELTQNLRPFSYYLQSASYLLDSSEKEEFLDELSSAGVKRFAPLGTITMGKDGAPHDGRLVLRELVQFIGDEIRVRSNNQTELTTSKDIKKAFEGNPHPPGYIFSSGGTTGEPKFVHFSYEEFDFVSDMLAKNFRAQGIREGMSVANLFVAGNLWSSFVAVERALEKIGAIQLPIGGTCPEDNISMYLEKFRPDVVMGIPSMLVKNAEYLEEKGKSLSIPKIFYAGEALSPARRDYLSKVWGVEYFGSAGYASVDAGVIGYQCSSCGPGEHHLFEDLVDLKIENQEAIISSLYRSSLPIQNYRTGDRVEFIGKCECGDPSRRFKLLGRTDNLIMIWSCRLMMEEIERTISEIDPKILSYQVILTEERRGNKVHESLSLYYEKNSEITSEAFLLALYKNSRDLQDTIGLVEFTQRARVIPVEAGMIPRNPRTGKISLVLDRRG